MGRFIRYHGFIFHHFGSSFVGLVKLVKLCVIISDVMDRFWSSKCLNDSLYLLDKMGLFAGGAITYLVG